MHPLFGAALGLILVVVASGASAREPAERHADIDRLLSAKVATHEAAQLFQNREVVSRAAPAAIRNGFAALRQATQTLGASAPASYAENLLSFSRNLARGVRAPPPSSLSDAVNECEQRNDYLIAALLASALDTALEAAAEDIRAELIFGPPAENPRLYGLVVVPRTSRELLHNLRYVLDHDLMLRRDFYTERNMQRFLAAPYAPILRTTAGDISASWAVGARSSFTGWPVAPDRNRDQCQYGARLLVGAGGGRSASVFISCNFNSALSPSLPEVEEAFGKEWKNTWRGPMHGPPPPASSRYGNQRMTYVLDKGGRRRTLNVLFESDGDFSSLELTEEDI